MLKATLALKIVFSGLVHVLYHSFQEFNVFLDIYLVLCFVRNYCYCSLEWGFFAELYKLQRFATFAVQYIQVDPK